MQEFRANPTAWRLVTKIESRDHILNAWFEDIDYGYLYWVRGNLGLGVFSEAIASIVAQHMSINHYPCVIEKGSEFSDPDLNKCDYVLVTRLVDATMPDMRYVSAQEYMDMFPQSIMDDIEPKQFPAMSAYINMLIFDAIIGNHKRGLDDFGFFIKLSPDGTLDNGTYSFTAPVKNHAHSLLADVDDDELYPTTLMRKGIDYDFNNCSFASEWTSQNASWETVLNQIKDSKYLRINSDYEFQLYCLDKIEHDIQPILKLMPRSRALRVKHYLSDRYRYIISSLLVRK